MSKNVKLMVEMDVTLDESINPNDVTFDIPLEKIRVDNGADKNVGIVTGYCTQEYIE